MDIFLNKSQKHIESLQVHLNLLACWKETYKARIIFLYNSDCICLKEESRIHHECLESE